jgi:hypothetical protein
MINISLYRNFIPNSTLQNNQKISYDWSRGQERDKVSKNKKASNNP